MVTLGDTSVTIKYCDTKKINACGIMRCIVIVLLIGLSSSKAQYLNNEFGTTGELNATVPTPKSVYTATETNNFNQSDQLHGLKIKKPQEEATKKSCNCKCGESNEDSRIVSGVETGVNEFPWITRLSYFTKHYCGGMIINDRFVLTAAHCAKGLMWFMIKATFGEHDRCKLTKRPETRFVINYLAHNFSFNTMKNDIALLQLNDKLTITYDVKPVCLPHDDANTFHGTNATAVGWGSLGESDNTSCVPREVQLPVLTNKECQDTKYPPKMITEEMLCAGYVKKGQKDTCQGDSGGPLHAERQHDKRFELLGIVSWGIGCARPGYPGVYTRITKYLYWIRHNARKGCFCSD